MSRAERGRAVLIHVVADDGGCQEKWYKLEETNDSNEMQVEKCVGTNLFSAAGPPSAPFHHAFIHICLQDYEYSCSVGK